jgi:uncharacterized protein (TIGR03067 family)
MLRKLALTLSLLATLPATADTASEAAKFSGSWIAAEAQRDGKPAPGDIGHQLAFNGDQFIITSNGQPIYSGTFTLDLTSQPAKINFVHSQGEAKGTTWEGIYRFEGNNLIICDDAFDPAKERPTSFATSSGSGHVLITFKRQTS